MTSPKILYSPWKDVDSLQVTNLTNYDIERLSILKTFFSKWYKFNLTDSYLTEGTHIKTDYRGKLLLGNILETLHPKYEVSLKGGLTLTLDRNKLLPLSPLSTKSRIEVIRKEVVREWEKSKYIL